MNSPKYAWDTSVILAWLCEDENYPLGGIEAVIQQITPTDQKPKAVLIVSVMAYSEILEAKHTKEQMDKLNDFLRRSNVIVADSDIRVAQKAGEIRSRGLAEGRKIQSPDATHLVAALIYKADVFHTFDEPLIKLDGSPIVEKLKICMPISLEGQAMMF